MEYYIFIEKPLEFVIAALILYKAAGKSEKKGNNDDLLKIVRQNWHVIKKNVSVNIKSPDDWMSFFKDIFESNNRKTIDEFFSYDIIK